MKAMVLIFGVLAAVAAGGVAALLVGDVAGYVIAGILLVIAVAGLFAGPYTLKAMLGLMLAVLVAAIGIGGWGAATVASALMDTDGPVADPDAVALASADGKIDVVEDDAAFRLELSEAELRAYTLDALQDEPDNPISDITYDIVPSGNGDSGELRFEAELKNGGTTAEGAVSAEIDAGSVNVEIVDLGLGAFQLPGLAEGAVGDLVEGVADFSTVLDEQRADVQSIMFTVDAVVITGTQAGGAVLTSESFLAGFADQAASAVEITTPPPERLGPGDVNGKASGSAPYYVALGDSLAANVGVDEARDGYVSRLHNQLQIRDDREYGLRNFGVSGETTGTMIRGQLDEAVTFLESNDVDYITIDVGANNLLGHLGSADCAQNLDTPACLQRVANSFARYPADLVTIFSAVTEAAPDATIVFLTAYNPFNLGFGTDLEAEMDVVMVQFNSLAITQAEAAGIIVADGFGPMQGTASATTHMLDAVPDIHPNAIGHDILGSAIVDALE